MMTWVAIVVVIGKSDVVVDFVDIDPNNDDHGGCDNHDSNNDLMMVVIDLGNVEDGWSRVPKIEIEGFI